MKILVADDDKTTRSILSALATHLGHEVLQAEDGQQALNILRGHEPPLLAILDWDMPYHTGVEICAHVRRRRTHVETYLLLVTGRGTSEDLVVGLEAGANDYIAKPFHHAELKARINVGIKVVTLQQEVLTLSSLLPICAWCKNIRDETDQWIPVEKFVAQKFQVNFTHGICATCRDSHFPHAATIPIK